MDVLTNLEHKNHLNFLFGRSGVVVEKGKTYLYTVRPKKKTWKLFVRLPSFYLRLRVLTLHLRLFRIRASLVL